QPGAVHPVMHRRGAEVPQEQLAGAGVERVPAQLVPGPLADRYSGEVADVVVVEHEQGTEPTGLQRAHGAAEPVLAEPGHVDAPLEIDVHPPRGWCSREGGHRRDRRDHKAFLRGAQAELCTARLNVCTVWLSR